MCFVFYSKCTDFNLKISTVVFVDLQLAVQNKTIRLKKKKRKKIKIRALCQWQPAV